MTATDVLGLGGPPATGKSTAIKRFLGAHDLTTPDPFEYGLLNGTLYRDAEVALLGVYDDGDFTGTDRLAMNVAPDAKQFIRDASDSPTYDGYTILFEGDRLFTGPIIQHARDECGPANTWFPLLHVTAPELHERHTARDDDQSDTWLHGRHTKYQNLKADYDLPTVPHETPQDTDALVTTIRDCVRQGIATTDTSPIETDADIPDPDADVDHDPHA